jgi:cobalt-zinc-cadmium efflux system membrane fusion protein
MLMSKKAIMMVTILLLGGVVLASGVLQENRPDHENVTSTERKKDMNGHDHGAEEDHHKHHEETQAYDDHEGHGHNDPEHESHEGHDHARDSDCDEGEICPEHLVAEIEDALCRSDHVTELQPGQGMKVRLASIEAAEKAGIATSRPMQVSMEEGTGLPGRVGFNRNLFARITPLADGIVQRVLVQPGTRVQKNQVLAEIATPEVTALKAQLISARARRNQARETYVREKTLLERGITSRQEFLAAEADYRAADSDADRFRQQLLNYGLSDDDVKELLRTGANSTLLQVRAPFAGEVVEMETAIGESVSSGSQLFTIADLDTLWIELSISESRIYEAKMGASVSARFDGLPETVFNGRIFQVGAALDERSRVLKALAEVGNPEHKLKVGMFGQVRIITKTDHQVLGVPSDALQSIDGAFFVFVRLEDDLFELRRVDAGTPHGGTVPVRSGISPSDEVVTSQGFALKSEVLRARLGASCADH